MDGVRRAFEVEELAIGTTVAKELLEIKFRREKLKAERNVLIRAGRESTPCKREAAWTDQVVRSSCSSSLLDSKHRGVLEEQVHIHEDVEVGGRFRDNK